MSSKSGFVTVVGRPNSGKSTLVNKLVGEKVSIVTDKPQTTRAVVRGILTRTEGQIVFLDTPGVHKPIHRMNERMMNAVQESMNEVDVLVLMVDVSVSFGRGDEFTLEMIRGVTKPKILVLNKIDKIKKQELLPLIDRYSKIVPFDEIIPVSAKTGENAEDLITTLFKYLPEGPQYYPEDQYSDQQERGIAAEMVREKLIEATHDELPYSTAVVVDRFEESDDIDRIYMSIFVERDSQKAIIIGKAGSLLKEVGIAARKELEELLQKQVHLELHVKVRKDWRNDDDTLRSLGFPE